MNESHPRIVDVSSAHRSQPPAQPRWNEVLRGLREARGVTQDGWAALLGYGRATIHRWERGEGVPGPSAVEALITLCHDRGLLRRFESGRLCDLTITGDLLRELLAEARASAAPPEPFQKRREASERDAASPIALDRPRVLPRPVPAPRHNLPFPLSSFVGRAPELAAIVAILRDARIVTLTGAGGCGKSRLALEVGRALAGDYPDGVWLVELAPLADPALIPSVIASALGLATKPDEPILAGLVAALVSRQLLILLDNCEHLIATAARLVEALLQQCPDVRILATSREALGIAGEVRWRVPPLAMPPPEKVLPIATATGFAAVRLFVERASTVLPTFQPTDVDASAIIRTCRSLDGMPLAIELAAALVATLPVEQIAARLDRRFGLLTGGYRTASRRQRTLQATIDWSYELLSEPERLVLQRLAVFAGGWTLEAAEAVCAEGLGAPSRMSSPSPQENVLDLLSRLVAKSLVQVEDGDGQVRYRLLETIRQYSLEKLLTSGEAEPLHECHYNWYVALAERAEPHLIGAEQVAWFDALEHERDNVRAALTWCWKGGRAELGLRLTAALRWFWYVREDRENEGPVWLARFLALPGAVVTPFVRVKALAMSLMFDASVSSAARAEATWEDFRDFCEKTGDRASLIRNHWWSGRTALWKGDYPRAQTLFTEGIALAREAGDRWALALELEGLGWLAQERGENAEARRYYEESLENFRAGQDWRAVVWSLLLLGQTACRQGDFPVARRSLEEAREIGRQLRQKPTLWSVLRGLADVARNEGDYPKARALLAEDIDLARELADPGKVRGTLLAASWLAHEVGDAMHARALLRDVLVNYRDWDWRSDAKTAICVGGILAVEDGTFARGARLFGQVDRLPLWVQTLAPDLRRGYESGVAAAREALGVTAFEAARAEGQVMTLDEALAQATPDEARSLTID